MITKEQLAALFGEGAREYPCSRNRTGYYTEWVSLTPIRERLTAEGFTQVSNRTMEDTTAELWRLGRQTVSLLRSGLLGWCRMIVAEDEELFEGAGDRNATGEVSMVMMNMDYEYQSAKNNGYGFIITLADGSFLLYDGGYKTETAGLLDYLKSHTPAGQKPKIAAWVLTHAHGDHYGLFRDYMENFSDELDVERVLVCIPGEECYTGGRATDHFFQNNVPAYAEKVGYEIVVPYTGQLLHFPGVDMEILWTANELYPARVPHENNVSTVTRLVFPTKGGTTVLMPADTMGVANTRLVAQYGDYLRSDYLQVPHHGCGGATKYFFHAVDPEVVIYTTSRHFFTEWTAHPVRAWNNYLMNRLHVKRAIVADDGYQTIL